MEFSMILTKWLDKNINTSSSTLFSEQVKEALLCSITEANAKNILEIGFYYGASAVTMLEARSNIRVTSIDLGISPCTLEAAPVVKEHYRDRFTFIHDDSKNIVNYVSNEKFDLAFIDGDHQPLPVLRDIKSCLSLNIPYILFDDIYEEITESNYHPLTNWMGKDSANFNGVSLAINQMQNKGFIKPLKHWYIPTLGSKMGFYKTTIKEN